MKSVLKRQWHIAEEQGDEKLDVCLQVNEDGGAYLGIWSRYAIDEFSFVVPRERVQELAAVLDIVSGKESMTHRILSARYLSYPRRMVEGMRRVLESIGSSLGPHDEPPGVWRDEEEDECGPAGVQSSSIDGRAYDGF